jgi:hypothetical protein
MNTVVIRYIGVIVAFDLNQVIEECPGSDSKSTGQTAFLYIIYAMSNSSLKQSAFQSTKCITYTKHLLFIARDTNKKIQKFNKNTNRIQV